MLRRLLVEAPLRVHHGSLPRATNNATRAPSRRRMSTLRKNPNFSLVALFVALGNEPWWTLRGASTSNLLSIQVSPFYLHINALGLPSTLPTANSLGSFTRVLLILGSLALLAASLHPTAWWRNLAVYLGLSSLAELYFSFVMIYYWAETAIVQAYGVVPPYDGTASLQANILGLDFKYYASPLVTASFY